MKQTDRDALRYWERLRESVYNATTIYEATSVAEIERHRTRLESDFEAWVRFFLPHYAGYPFAPFQRRAFRRVLAHDEWFEVRSWSRELAKSTIGMFEDLYLALTRRKRFFIMAGNTHEAATRLLAPYKIELEANRRIQQYYGRQQTLGHWTEDFFSAKCGATFMALGAGETPRGVKNKAARPDVIRVDDFDTLPDCANPSILDKKWAWWEKDLYPTRSVSGGTLIVFNGNLIAEDCCVKRAGALADHWDIVNLRMVDPRHPNGVEDYRDGKSVWPEKNPEPMIDRVLSKMSYVAAMGEYFNTPISEGNVFGTQLLGKVPPLGRFPFLVIYGDPAPGQRRGNAASGSFKAVWLTGVLDDVLYVIKGRLFRGLNDDFIEAYFHLFRCAGMGLKVPVFSFIENNSLQDPFFQQVYKPLMDRKRRETGVMLSIQPDAAIKGDKAARIEANLEPLNRNGLLVFNEAEKDSPDMQELLKQFRLFTMRTPYPADGPDCIEGAWRMIRSKLSQMRPITIVPPSGRAGNKHLM